MALDYLPSPGWAVIYGETPSATRWSELGDNDDALATGAGIDDLAILTRHLNNDAVTGAKILNYKIARKNDTTNVNEATARILTGYAYIPYAVASNVTKAITFGTAFTNPPIVLLTFGGDNPSSNTYGAGGNLVEGIVIAKAHTISNAGFTAQLHKSGGGNFAAGFGFVQWAAIGI